MRMLGLAFGCIDLIVTPQGEYVFLEVNEMGQFLWVEQREPACPLLRAFATLLIEGRLDRSSVLVGTDRISFGGVPRVRWRGNVAAPKTTPGMPSTNCRARYPSPEAAMFRLEAVEYARARSHGTVVLARPLSHACLTWLFAAIAVALVLFFVLAGVTRKAEVRGVLLPAHGLIRVLCTQAGVVLERRVHEGQLVKAGDVMFVLGSERASKRDGDVEQAIASLLQTRRDSLSNEQQQLQQQTAQRADATQRKADGLAAEIRRITEQRALQQRRVALAEAALQRFIDLQSSGLVPMAEVQDKQAELLDQQQRLADLDRAQAATERDLDAVHDALRDLPLQAARERQAGQRDIATLEQDLTENDARRRVLVRAPQDGTVTAITAEPGQPAALHQALASVLPAGSRAGGRAVRAVTRGRLPQAGHAGAAALPGLSLPEVRSGTRRRCVRCRPARCARTNWR